MTIDLTPLDKATQSLAAALARHAREPDDDMVRDSVIQRFEFTYDLAHKMLRRVLEVTMADAEEVSLMTFPTMIRTGWEQGLVPGGWPAWEEFRKLRNLTSRTYDEHTAIAVASKVSTFYDEVAELSRRLPERLAR